MWRHCWIKYTALDMTEIKQQSHTPMMQRYKHQNTRVYRADSICGIAAYFSLIIRQLRHESFRWVFLWIKATHSSLSFKDFRPCYFSLIFKNHVLPYVELSRDFITYFISCFMLSYGFKSKLFDKYFLFYHCTLQGNCPYLE